MTIWRLAPRSRALFVSLLSAFALATVQAPAATLGSVTATTTHVASATYGYDEIAHNAHGTQPTVPARRSLMPRTERHNELVMPDSGTSLAAKEGTYAPGRALPRTKHGDPIPDSDFPHTQLGTRTDGTGTYAQARQWEVDPATGRSSPHGTSTSRTIDFRARIPIHISIRSRQTIP